jgi:hypothetical protein
MAKAFSILLLCCWVNTYNLNAQWYKQTLDSTVSINYDNNVNAIDEKVSYNYSPVGVLLRQDKFNRDTLGLPWEMQTRIGYTYDTQNRISKTEEYSYPNGNMEPKLRTHFYYDTNGVSELKKVQQWSQGQWENQSQLEIQNNTQNLPLETQAYGWNSANQQWYKESSKTFYTYLASGKQLSYNLTNGTLGKWVSHHYNAQNQLQFTYEYDAIAGFSDTANRFSFSYDAQGRLSEYLVDRHRITTTQGNYWEPEDRYTFSYDTTGIFYTVTILEYRWDLAQNQWGPIRVRRAWQHDMTVPYSDLITEDFPLDSLAFVRKGGRFASLNTFGSLYKLDNYKEWRDMGATRLRIYKQYYYSNRLVNLPEAKPKQLLKLYPNPSQGKLHLQFDEVQDELNLRLSALSGQVVQTLSLNKTDKVELDLPPTPGVYLLHVWDGKIAQQYKVLRE